MKKTLFRSKSRMACYIFDGTLEMAVALVKLAPVTSRIEINATPKVETRNSYGVVLIEEGDGVVDFGNGELNRVQKKELEADWEKEP